MSTALKAAQAKTKGKRMLRDALEAYGEDEYTLSEWNTLKRQAERDGKWRWKESDTSATVAAVKDRITKGLNEEDLSTRFITNLDAVMQTELHSQSNTHRIESHMGREDHQCSWRERIGGKTYYCSNDIPPEKLKVGAAPLSESGRRYCKWHARECTHIEHPIERRHAIEIPNEHGFCMFCFEVTALKDRGTLQRVPPRLPSTKIPGVSLVELKREVQREILLKAKKKAKDENEGLSFRLNSNSVCAWEKEQSESAYVWRCQNRVLMHPVLRGAFLPFCGYHAPRCIQGYGGARGRKTVPCPPIDRKNPFGMCRNHVESHLSTLSFEARGNCRFTDSEFDVPGIIECRRDRLAPQPKRHPLAPRLPPPGVPADVPRHEDVSFVLVKSVISPSPIDRVVHQLVSLEKSFRRGFRDSIGPLVLRILSHPNFISSSVKELMWRIKYMRRAGVVATRIQSIFRGNRARRRVRAMKWESEALRRLEACVKIQRIARGHIGRLMFEQQVRAIQTAVPIIQCIVRGGLARIRFRRLKAVLCIQRNFQAYRQRCFAWAMREEIAYMRTLQQQADANYQEMLIKLHTFRRLRARRVLRSHVLRWRRRKQEEERRAAERLQSLLSAVKIQRAFRRYMNYKHVTTRYTSAQKIQKRVRGWLTRHLWKDDPGILWITSFINTRSGFEYGKAVVLAQPIHSYSFPSRRIRMRFGTLAIQRVYRGFLGRIEANMRWVAILRRWEWLSLEGSTQSTDSMTLGHERYGFMLPSYSYHPDKKRHMLPVKRDIKPDRGYAYKYQNILELILDRDGKRAWSLAKEEKWKKEGGTLPRSQRMNIRTIETRRSKHSQNMSKVCSYPVREKGIGIARAMFPIGCVVFVASTSRRDRQRFRKAKVVDVRCGDPKQENQATFDVEYFESFCSERGVRIYREISVPRPRIRAITEEYQLSESKPRSVGVVIREALKQLKNEIKRSQQERLQRPTITDEPITIVMKSVDEIVDRLRDEDPHSDLLIDHRDFVDFVFQNSQILRTKWLQVVDHLRYGTRERQVESKLKTAAYRPIEQPITPNLVALYQEFGFDVPHKDVVVPMPERANEIETRMESLGFLHEPSANICDENIPKNHEKFRPHSTPSFRRRSQHYQRQDSNNRFRSGDDSTTPRHAKSTSTSMQDLHQLIYQLKTLPRERHHEKIIEVTTRHARSFICGYPACGRCFSSPEAARLHQEGVHLHQRRLASATPIVDQYMHAFWPPQSPWNQEHHRSFVPSVGCFQCQHLGCNETQFRSRRELLRHMARIHKYQGVEKPEDDAAGESLEQSPVQDARLTPASVVWLGAYSMCRSNLHERLEGFPQDSTWHGSDVVLCDMHPISKPDPERCRECFRRNRRIVMPCRLYRTVAVPGVQQLRQSDQSDGTSTGYVIFSTEDSAFCPVVCEQDLLALDEDEAHRMMRVKRQEMRMKRVVNPTGAPQPSSLVFLRVVTLCRDASGVNWAIGHVYRPVTWKGEATRVEKESHEEYEVMIDTSHVVAVCLEDILAACVVHRSSYTSFKREHQHKDESKALWRLYEPSATTRTKSNQVAYVRVTLHRFCRDTIEAGTERE